MAIKLVGSAGAATSPSMLDLPASGVIWKDSVVVYDAAANVVSMAAAGAPCTAIIGVSQKYVQGASDTFIPVILFDDSQIWEVDCVSAAATTQLLLRHILDSGVRVENISSVSESASAGVFFALAISGSTSGSGKLLGKFLRRTQIYPSTLWSVALYNAN